MLFYRKAIHYRLIALFNFFCIVGNTKMVAKTSGQAIPTKILKQFQEAKDVYAKGHYNQAKKLFQALLATNNSSLTPYIFFYYALSTYHHGKLNLSKQIFHQISVKFPLWDQKNEVYYWCAQCSFEEGHIQEALDYLVLIQDKKILPQALKLKKFYLKKVKDLVYLKQLTELFPNDQTLKKVLCKKAAYHAYLTQDKTLINQLEAYYGCPIQPYRPLKNIQSKYKDIYHIAILLPFFTEELDYEQCKEQFIIELYQGIQLAKTQLDKEGIHIKLFAFDTKKNQDITTKILQEKSMKNMDFIIGPLYPNTIPTVSKFCKEYKINFMNPISTNSAILNDNPFAFLFQPSLETQAQKAAQLTINDIQQKTIEEPHIAVFFGNEQEDILQANLYKQILETQLGQKVKLSIEFQNDESIKDFFKQITQKEEEGEEESEITIQDQDQRITPKITYLDLKKITHIYCPSRNKFLVSHVVNLPCKLHIKPQIIGHEEWITKRILTFHQLTTLPILLLAPNYIVPNNPIKQELQKKFFKQINTPPTKYHFIGYEMMLFIGRMLSKHGTYFQKELENEDYTSSIFQKIYYNKSQSNQHIPILKFKANKFIVV